MYLSVVRDLCYKMGTSCRQCASLLQYLDYTDMLAVMMTKVCDMFSWFSWSCLILEWNVWCCLMLYWFLHLSEKVFTIFQEFNLGIMEECISIGTQSTLQKYNRESDIPSTGNQSVEWMFDPLFQASQLTLMRHINNIVNLLPVPHEIVNFSDAKDRQTSKYFEKLEDFITENSSLEIVFMLASSLLQYLVSMSVLPWKPKVPSESQNDICRFCTFCMEVSENYARKFFSLL